MASLFSLHGRVAVVIGGTGVLCGEMAAGLARAGAEVVLVGRNEEKARARLEPISAGGGRAWFHPAEASSKSELEALLASVLARSGRVDVVVNGAGINSATPILDISEEEVDRILGINYKSVFSTFRFLAAIWSSGARAARLSISAPCPGSSRNRVYRPALACIYLLRKQCGGP